MPNPPPARPLIGVALMVTAMAILPSIDVLAKFLGQAGVPILMIVWARALFGALLTLPFALRADGARAFLPPKPWHHLARATLLFSATFAFFHALKHLPIADALAIFFINPLIIVVLSALVLREKVGPRRWAAVVVGFIGTMIIIRPGFVDLNPGTLYALAAGVALGSYFVMTRNIAGQSDAMVLTFQTSALGAALMTLMLPFIWVAPTAQQWLMFAALGVIATFAHMLITRSYEHAEASLLAPLAFTEIITAILVGWWFFGDLPDGWTILGVAVLIASAIYISVREQQAAHRVRQVETGSNP